MAFAEYPPMLERQWTKADVGFAWLVIFQKPIDFSDVAGVGHLAEHAIAVICEGRSFCSVASSLPLCERNRLRFLIGKLVNELER